MDSVDLNNVKKKKKIAQLKTGVIPVISKSLLNPFLVTILVINKCF